MPMKHSLNAVIGTDVEMTSPLQITETGEYSLSFENMESFDNSEDPVYKDKQITYAAQFREVEGMHDHRELMPMYGFYKDYSFKWLKKYTPSKDYITTKLDMSVDEFHALSDPEKKELVFELPHDEDGQRIKGRDHLYHVEKRFRVPHQENTEKARKRIKDMITILRRATGQMDLDPNQLVQYATNLAKNGEPVTVEVELRKSKGGYIEIKQYLDIHE